MNDSFTRRLKKAVFLIVLVGLASFNVAIAGSYEDFFKAIKSDDASTIQRLLTRGFDVNTVDPQGQVGLLVSLREPSLKVASLLIDSPQVNLNAVNTQGESPLMLAAIKGHFELAQKMIQKGADINKTGWTPLHYAASTGQLKMIGFLLEQNAYIDAESPNGTTPLMMASLYASLESVQLLLDQGADPLLKNEQGLTALQFAERGKRVDAVALLSKTIRAQRPLGQW